MVTRKKKTPERHQIERAIAERERYAKDFKSYAEDHLKVKDRQSKEGGGLIPLILNPAQSALHSMIEQWQQINMKRHGSKYPVKVIIVKPRKVGISTYFQARGFWRLEHQNDVHAVTMAHRDENSKYIAGMQATFHHAFDDLPYPLRLECTATNEGLKWGPDHRSRMFVKTAGSTNRAGAGMTPSFIHFSEAAHFTDQEEVAAVLNSAASFSEIYVESTANGEGNRFHNMWQNAMDWDDARRVLKNESVDYDVAEHAGRTWNGFVRFFWPWIFDPDYREECTSNEVESILNTLDEEEEELVKDYGVTPEQLKWRRRKIAGECSEQIAMEPLDYFHQEYPLTPEQAFVASGGQVFRQDILARMARDARLPANQPEVGRWFRNAPCEWEVFGSSPLNATWRVWEKAKPGHAYVVSGDPAQGLEHGDWSVISVFDRCDGTRIEEVARARGKWDASEVGELCVHIAQMYNDAFVINEKNGIGSTASLRIAEIGYWNVFQSRDPESFKDRDNPRAFTIGFHTGSRSRQVLVREGQRYLRDGHILLRDRDAIREWKIFIWDKNGKPQAPDNENDDCVLADLMACHAAFKPTSGIPPIGIMPDEYRETRKEEESPDAHFHRVNKKRWEKQNKKNVREAKRRAQASAMRVRSALTRMLF